MSDNTTLNAASGGDVIATDDVGGIKFQRIKLALGADGTAADAPVGGGVESGSLRVTIASDSTGVLSVDDNGNSLTVDGSVNATLAAETTKVIGTVNIAAAQTLATVTTVSAVTAITNALPAGTNAIGKLSANSGVDIGDVDVTSITPGTAATSLGKAEDAAHTSGDVGVMALSVRSDSDAALAGTTGDYAPLQTDANGYLKVNIKAGAGSGGTASTDDAAFTAASGSGTPIMGFATSDAVDSGDCGVVGMTTTRSLKTVVTDSAGTVIDPQVDDAAYTAATSLVSVVGGIVTSDSVDSGDAGAFAMTAAREQKINVPAGAANIAKAEDVASADADVGVPAMAVRKATPANTSGTDGDYEFLQMSAGRLWVDPSGVTLTVASHAVTNAGTFAVQSTIAAGATNIAKAEDVASADADVGVPAMAVRKATPANTSGTDGDYEMLQMSAGRLWVDPSGVTLTVASHAVTNAGTFATQPTLQTGSALVGDVGISGARTAGGTTIFRSLDIDETEEEIKATAGQVYWIHAMNLTNAKLYLKFYNATAATVVVGTTTPVLTFPLATQGDTNGAGFTLAIPNGIVFGTAITVACTGALADNDTTAPAANACVINIGYA